MKTTLWIVGLLAAGVLVARAAVEFMPTWAAKVGLAKAV